MARLDPLAAALLRAEAGDWSDDAKAALAHEAGRFLRAGGTLSLSEWAAASEEAREAFVAAGDALRLRPLGQARASGPPGVRDERGASEALRRAVDRVAGAIVA